MNIDEYEHKALWDLIELLHDAVRSDSEEVYRAADMVRVYALGILNQGEPAPPSTIMAYLREMVEGESDDE